MSRKIFLDRLIRGWKYQYKVIRTIADWTIILYLIIPASMLFIYFYRSWWLETPSWLAFIPMLFVFFVIYLLSWSGNIRTYVQEADKIFLVKNSDVFMGMRKWGYAYSLFVQVVHVSFTIVVLLPFLRNHFLLDWQQIFSIWFYFIGLNVTLMLVKFYLRKIEMKFKKIIANVFLFLAFGLVNQLIYILWEKGQLFLIYMLAFIMLAVSIRLSLKTIKRISSIDHDIEMEQELKSKNTEMIFNLSFEIEKSVVSKRTKPILFRRSKRIFKKRTMVTGFMELFFKVFIRNHSYVRSYFQIITVTTAAMVIIPPLWIKAIIFIGYLIMMKSWLSLIWDKILTSNPMNKKYNESNSYFTARKRTITMLFLLAIIILCLFITCWFFILSYFKTRFGLQFPYEIIN
ncbi:ABC transporter permease [Bacillus sp. Bva_UNVM-123]|uniref:ABC transporter permease n=1 Tax=Bacillus sp. Bva_UNVM-123 TaxID=2829798 RepID=UPI00391EF535